jgi:hypothetical protein
VKDPDYPCVCGDVKAIHFHAPNDQGELYFSVCLVSSCSCSWYKQDNLRYLEMKAHE